MLASLQTIEFFKEDAMVNYKTWKNRLFNFVVVLLLVLITLACLLPLLDIVALSFSSKIAAVSG